MALNTTALMGRLTYEPELKSTNNGISVLNFQVAVDRSYQKGEEKQTDFIDCVAWRQTAEFIKRNFHKGMMIALTGEINTRNVPKDDGTQRKFTEVVVSNVSFCGSKENGSQPAGEQNTEFEEIE